MTSHKYTESDLENAVLEWFEELGYSIEYGPDIGPDNEKSERESHKDIILIGRLRDAIERINSSVPREAQEDAIKKVIAVAYSSANLLIANHAFHKMLADGVDVEYQRPDGSVAGDKVYLIDTINLDRNDWLAVNQYTVVENKHNRRPDVLIFVNGIPLAIFELKNPIDLNATLGGAYNQIQTYKSQIPSLFAYNELCVIADHDSNTLIGSVSANMERFLGWKSIDGETIYKTNDIDVLIKGVFSKNRFLDIIKNFVVFENEKDSRNNITQIIKKVAAYHQYFAVNKAIASTVVATSAIGDKRAGVVWHTQGSGKSLSMVFYAGKIIQKLDNPTLIVLTDRNDLDGQLFDTFSKCSELIRQNPKQAESREHLKTLLTVASGGVVFTTIQKFMVEEKGATHPLLSDRRNIVVIADEAHRSQYDFIDGFARHLHDALPNASFIGFTGTPIELSDKNTRAVFGEYIDVYDIARAVEDKATVPIYYEARLAKMSLLKEVTPKVDTEFEELTEGEETEKKEQLKSKWARLEAMVGSDKRISLIAKDLIEHFEARLSAMDGKGMFVAMSRRIAVELYEEVIKLRPEWHSNDIRKGFIKVVMTGKASDPGNYQPHLYTKEERNLLADRMKNPKDELKLVIVRDMWLTGFDAPSMHTMYIDKPMQGHGLMQAIARVNRVYKDKPGGLVVDYLGIAPSLKEALSYYTQAGKEEPIGQQENAISLLLEKFEIVKNMYHGFDYNDYFSDSAKTRTETARRAWNYVLGLPDGKKRYTEAVANLSKSFALASSSDEAEKIHKEVEFFQTVRGYISKLESTGLLGRPSTDNYDHAIRQIISDAVVSDKVINIFDAAGLKNPNISILSDEFLDEVRGLEQKNVALEMLKKILSDEAKSMEKTFLVKSRTFSQMLEGTIKRYQNQTIEAAQIIVELVELAKKIREEKERGENLNLTQDEVAFYDALCENESAIKELGDETLKKIAQELVIILRKSTTIDWTLKESVRARLRISVKKLLHKYHYPPDKEEQATKIVLEQAEILCKDWMGQ